MDIVIDLISLGVIVVFIWAMIMALLLHRDYQRYKKGDYDGPSKCS